MTHLVNHRVFQIRIHTYWSERLWFGVIRLDLVVRFVQHNTVPCSQDCAQVGLVNIFNAYWLPDTPTGLTFNKTGNARIAWHGGALVQPLLPWKSKAVLHILNVFVASGIQHAIRIRHIVICGLFGSSIYRMGQNTLPTLSRAL